LEALKETQRQSTTQSSPNRLSHYTNTSFVSSPSLPTPSNQSNDSRPSVELFQPPAPNFPIVSTLDDAISQTSSRTIADLEVGARSIDDCFGIFYGRYLPQLPALEIELAANDCYAQSRYLFWVIVAIGSRRYHQDPTLLSQLAPHITKMTEHAAFSREKSLNTISAFMLLCTWPLPYNSMSKDISHILSGVLLQHSLSVGLHSFGVGQDFSRVKLQQDRAQMYFRARLWVLCIVICQRISCTEGMPPVYIPDNYDHDSQQAQSVYALPPALRFQKTLSRILTESILELERYALSKVMQQRAAVLNPIIDAASLSLAELEPECPTQIDRYYLISAELQITIFHLLGPKESFDDAKLTRMHELACRAVETLAVLNQAQSWVEDAPATALKYLNLAAFTLLKLSRCPIAHSLDLARGKSAYFTAISIFRKSAIDGEDIFSRSAKILTQLWTSKQIFKKPDGTTDALTLRCGSRLAMSIMYDCLWWWRVEFAGLPNPYEEKGTLALVCSALTDSRQIKAWTISRRTLFRTWLGCKKRFLSLLGLPRKTWSRLSGRLSRQLRIRLQLRLALFPIEIQSGYEFGEIGQYRTSPGYQFWGSHVCRWYISMVSQRTVGHWHTGDTATTSPCRPQSSNLMLRRRAAIWSSL
jgi:transcriptional regulatory protein LEU3